MITSRPKTRHDNQLILIGAPTDEGASVEGSRLAPATLRSAGLAHALKRVGWQVHDRGDVSPDECSDESFENPADKARNFVNVLRWVRSLSAAAYDAAANGRPVICVGGDHSISMGTVSGVARYWAEKQRPLFLLWLDSHADFNTPATTPTGNLHGMSLAMLCGEFGSAWRFGTAQPPLIPASNVLVAGARSLDDDEALLLQRRGIQVITADAFRSSAIDVMLNQFLTRVAQREGVLHVSLDMDVLDPAVAPGVGTPEPGGPSLQKMLRVMDLLRASKLVRSLDIVEFNPLLDIEGRTVSAAMQLAATLFDTSAHRNSLDVPRAVTEADHG